MLPDPCSQDGLHARYSEAIEQERAESGILRTLVEARMVIAMGSLTMG